MNDVIQAIMAKQEIFEVLATYCRGVDRCDADIVRSAYHPDSYDNHGYWKGNGHDFADFVVARLKQANSVTMHSLSNVLIDLLETNVAVSEAQVTVTLVRAGASPTTVDVMGARYLDRLDKRDGVWKIAERTVVLEWTKVETWPGSLSGIPLDEFTWGKRKDRGDPVYSLLANGTLYPHQTDQGA